MRLTLATLLAKAVEDISEFSSGKINVARYLEWVDRYQSQLVVLAAQIIWSSSVEEGLNTNTLEDVLKVVEGTLNVLADSVLQEQPPVRRKKLENLVSYIIASCYLCNDLFLL